MALPINVEDLLRQRKVESNRIEFKKGWNPDRVYRSICAFANDFDNIGGGYILVGVDEEKGIAKRPVHGIPIELIDDIQKDITNYNNKINPYYLPRTEPVEVDEKTIIVIWCPSGINRPYDVPEYVTSNNKPRRKCYIRSGSSTIEAKGYVLDELREMANRVPFDDRGNPEITINDISGVHVLDYLHKIDSKLANDFGDNGLESILEQMDLFVGPKENRMIKNVTAMMFCPYPVKFFPYTQVEIVIFPEGVFENPRNFKEVPPIRGTVPQMIEETMRYMRTMIIQLHIIKQTSGPSKRIYNYPEKALEEALTNAFYHRDYRSRTPIVVEVQPYEITISSATGPDRSISMAAIQKGQRMVSRYYRNRRLGEFLKELSLTEGRNTGIPTIQRELARNGSAAATFETDEDRLSFLVRIPCHEGEEGVSSAFMTFEGNNKEANNHDKENDKETENYDKELQQRNLSDLQIDLLKLVNLFPNITFNELAFKLNITVSALRNQRKQLESKGIFLCRKGATKNGTWEIEFK
jgi:ATP-dependent DNA helicase RecG